MNVLLLIIITCFVSCSQPKLGDDKIDLENIELNFDVRAFYENELTKEKKYQEKLEEGKIDGFFGYFDELNDFHWIEVDTIYNEDLWGTKRNLIGVQYNMRSWTPNDRVAYYNEMYFKKIDMMIDANGEFMALTASNESPNENAFKNILNYLEKKNGKAKVIHDDFFGAYKVYLWELKDRVLAISSKYDDKKNMLKLDVEIDENTGVRIDTTKHSTINTNLFILNNKFKQDSIVRKMSSGSWLYFNGILSKE